VIVNQLLKLVLSTKKHEYKYTYYRMNEKRENLTIILPKKILYCRRCTGTQHRGEQLNDAIFEENRSLNLI